MKINVGRENSGLVELYVEDIGFGSPVLLVHGWPLSSIVWERQVLALLMAGHRVITYDRRGFGRSSRPSVGYDFDTLAEDLNGVLTTLDVRDCVVVGYGMGCGEVVRYLGNYGADRIRGAAFFAPLPPCLAQMEDSSSGLSEDTLLDCRKRLADDRHGYLAQFLAEAYSVLNDCADGGLGISDAAFKFHCADASAGAVWAQLECLQSWATDFRDDLPRIGLPVMVVQGSRDRVMPVQLTGEPLAQAIATEPLLLVDSAPHGLLWTHVDEVNEALLRFAA